MQVTIQSGGAVSVALVQGRLDSNTASAAETDMLAALEANGFRLVVDLGQVDYVSSAGLRVMLILAKRAKQARGRLVLCNLTPQVEEVFEISGFGAIMTIAASREEALATL